MLKHMRQHAKYFYVLFFLIILSFIFWGVGTVDRQQGTVPVARIGDDQITTEEFWRSYDRISDLYRDIYGDKFDDQMKEELKQQVLDTLIEGRVLYQAALDAGLTVTDRELQDNITNDPKFTRDGIFDSTVYERTLELNRMNPAYYEALKRRELLTQKMQRIIEASVDILPYEYQDIQGDPQIVEQLKEALIQRKRTAALKSFVEGMKATMEVQVNPSIIS